MCSLAQNIDSNFSRGFNSVMVYFICKLEVSEDEIII